MLGTLLFSDLVGELTVNNSLETLIFPNISLNPAMVPNDAFEIYGYFTGTRDAILRVREDTVGDPLHPTGTIILTINLTAGQGLFYGSATYKPIVPVLIKVTGQRGAGSGNGLFEKTQLSWTCEDGGSGSEDVTFGPPTTCADQDDPLYITTWPVDFTAITGPNARFEVSIDASFNGDPDVLGADRVQLWFGGTDIGANLDPVIDSGTLIGNVSIDVATGTFTGDFTIPNPGPGVVNIRASVFSTFDVDEEVVHQACCATISIHITGVA